MILTVPYERPFARRVAVALHILGLSHERRRWSAFPDTARLATLKPLRRAPVLAMHAPGRHPHHAACAADREAMTVFAAAAPPFTAPRRQGPA